ncbi:MAG: competence protein ComEA [Deltaproteobacteria bacterium]|nr:competence protein ComEA [Deltaproteobacteria bacterium]
MFRFFIAILTSLFFTVTAWAGVNVNQASETDLVSLPGIGPVKASAIVQYRTEHGPFKSVTDLDAVPGIGPATLQNITPLVVFDGKSGAPAKPDDGTASPQQAATPTPNAVNINKADAASLQVIPGIGPSKAKAIVDDRTANGPFNDCADLQRVRGIGAATVNGLGGYCITK